MRGTVKFYNKMQGWGFITNSEGKDVFVHKSNVKAIVDKTIKTLETDDIVEFEMGMNSKNGKEQAVNVEVINEEDR